MHLVQDENGNTLSHHHEADQGNKKVSSQEQHCGSGHDCSSCKGDCNAETVALLEYMLQHNEHHAAELDQIAANLRKLGMNTAADQVSEGVSEYLKGNMRLGLALTLVKEQIKEAK